MENKGNPDRVLQSIYAKSRDNARTPFQWDDGHEAGFTTGKPWIKVNPNYTEINAKQAVEDENSIYHYYRKLIRLRKQHPIIVHGNYQLILPDDEQVFTYMRTFEHEKLLIITNFSADHVSFELPSEVEFEADEILIGNYKIESDHFRKFTLRPYEARVYKGF